MVLRLGRLWNCVVLLDEADVFLEERSLADMQRNALVSVFLRVLEYYDGILILTSNRVGTFDEAFKSRIQLSLHYENLTPCQRHSYTQLIVYPSMPQSNTCNRRNAPDMLRRSPKGLKFGDSSLAIVNQIAKLIEASAGSWEDMDENSYLDEFSRFLHSKQEIPQDTSVVTLNSTPPTNGQWSTSSSTHSTSRQPTTTPIFACSGNICRSPMAESRLRVANLFTRERRTLNRKLASPGTDTDHTAQWPDLRALGILEEHGIQSCERKTRQATYCDLCEFDYILCYRSA